MYADIKYESFFFICALQNQRERYYNTLIVISSYLRQCGNMILLFINLVFEYCKKSTKGLREHTYVISLLYDSRQVDTLLHQTNPPTSTLIGTQTKLLCRNAKKMFIMQYLPNGISVQSGFILNIPPLTYWLRLYLNQNPRQILIKSTYDYNSTNIETDNYYVNSLESTMGEHLNTRMFDEKNVLNAW